MVKPRLLPIRGFRLLLLLVISCLVVSLSWDFASALSHAAYRGKHRKNSRAQKKTRGSKPAKRVFMKRFRGTDGRLIAIIWGSQASASTAALGRDAIAGAFPLTEPERDQLERSLQDEMPPPGEAAPAAVVDEPPLIWPTAGPIGSAFGVRRGGFHAGIDIAAPRHQPVIAAADGRVLYARPSRGRMGKAIVLQHADGMLTIYAHLAKIVVQEEDTVGQGDMIGTVGSTGRSTGPHLHFAVRVDNTTLNPQQFLPTQSETDTLRQANAR